ncbi:Hypothetical protein CAP_1320 [Chondromyces apiculatus DSM 436]|uniref:Uncharacterized protein n=1 Tax=Chondromyces apiculatus DSM 436 TaxID=1192034 RepID=A0A017TES2_9BACT|nr:Hypothetical protein CAP_1320 [Chondromyces apiculatus DSM 436]
MGATFGELAVKALLGGAAAEGGRRVVRAIFDTTPPQGQVALGASATPQSVTRGIANGFLDVFRPRKEPAQRAAAPTVFVVSAPAAAAPPPPSSSEPRGGRRNAPPDDDDYEYVRVRKTAAPPPPAPPSEQAQQQPLRVKLECRQVEPGLAGVQDVAAQVRHLEAAVARTSMATPNTGCATGCKCGGGGGGCACGGGKELGNAHLVARTANKAKRQAATAKASKAAAHRADKAETAVRELQQKISDRDAKEAADKRLQATRLALSRKAKASDEKSAAEIAARDAAIAELETKVKENELFARQVATQSSDRFALALEQIAQQRGGTPSAVQYAVPPANPALWGQYGMTQPPWAALATNVGPWTQGTYPVPAYGFDPYAAQYAPQGPAYGFEPYGAQYPGQGFDPTLSMPYAPIDQASELDTLDALAASMLAGAEQDHDPFGAGSGLGEAEGGLGEAYEDVDPFGAGSGLGEALDPLDDGAGCGCG